MSKYATPPQALPIFNANPESIIDTARQINDERQKILDQVVSGTTPAQAAWTNTLELMEMNENRSGNRANIITFYQHMSTDAALRKASTSAEELLEENRIDCAMREDVFKVVDGAYQTRHSQGLEQDQLHILEKARQNYVRNGLLLPPGTERDRFKKIQKELSRLCIQSQKNLNEENGGVWFAKEELEGIPKESLDLSTLEQGTGEHVGKVKVNFTVVHKMAVAGFAPKEETRRRYWIAENNKANHNVENFKKIIQLRDEAARLVGYENHAASKLEDKMAKTSEDVISFLEKLRSGLREGSLAEVDQLLAMKKEDCETRGASFDGNFYEWDYSYHKRLLKKKTLNLDALAVAEYFPVASTLAGMLKVYEESFGMKFVELDQDARQRLSPTGNAADVVWDEDVRLFSVWDDEESGGAFNGYLYVDLYPRQGKYPNYACFPLERGYTEEDGSRHYPVSAMMCNAKTPSPDKPALLKHVEAVVFFHELGHGIHDLLSRTRYASTHGTNVVVDFVEAPSQLLEEWCWTPSVIKSLSKHWETGESMPDEMIESVVKSKQFLPTGFILSNVHDALFDMAVHSPRTHEEVTQMNPGELYNQIRHDVRYGLKGPEDQGEPMHWGNGHAAVVHFIGGYDVGFYGYLYSRVFSLDIFHTFFKQNPLDKEQGRRYRQMILAKGGSMDEMEMLQQYLGREPDLTPFCIEAGMPPES